jgi:translation initiation factor 2 subunit 3
VAEVKSKTDKSPEGNAVEAIDPRRIPSSNIGMVGHVAHGKTTLAEALTGKLTLTHSEELKRGITIRLGYADISVYKCKPCDRYCPDAKCPYCEGAAELQRTLSLIDAPGHETLMATVLTGTSLMDGAILVIAANEHCPQPQTKEHLTALEVAGIKNVIIAQTKIDLVDEAEARKNYAEIKAFVKGTAIEGAPIVPVSAQKRINMDVLLAKVQAMMPDHAADAAAEPKMLVARSFDINKPGIHPSKIVGGVLGGSIVAGMLRVGDEIEIRPGVKKNDTSYHPLRTTVTGLQKAGLHLHEAGPGGLLGVMTELDPALTKSDLLVGNIVGFPGKLPESVSELELDASLLERVVGSEAMAKVEPLRVGDSLMINVGTSRSVGVIDQKKKTVHMKLKIPLCVEKGERVVISRQVSGRWRLIGYGIVF